MVRTFKHDSLLVNKESYCYIKQYNRKRRGYGPLSEESLDRLWKRIHCKEQNETLARIDKDTFSISMEQVKELLTSAGLTYIDDGKKVEGFYL